VINIGSLLVIVAIVAIVLLFVGGFVQALQWLLWIGIVLLVIAVIAWLLRFLSGRRNTSIYAVRPLACAGGRRTTSLKEDVNGKRIFRQCWPSGRTDHSLQLFATAE